MTTTIDKDKALELLDAAVTLKGADYVLPYGEGCLYFEEDGTTPVCIVGHALASVGVKLGDLGPIKISNSFSNYYGKDAEMDNQRVLRSTEIDGVELSEDARLVFDQAQSYQDEGWSWGEAVSMVKGETK
jgi:hypothetical protein